MKRTVGAPFPTVRNSVLVAVGNSKLAKSDSELAKDFLRVSVSLVRITVPLNNQTSQKRLIYDFVIGNIAGVSVFIFL